MSFVYTACIVLGTIFTIIGLIILGANTVDRIVDYQNKREYLKANPGFRYIRDVEFASVLDLISQLTAVGEDYVVTLHGDHRRWCGFDEGSVSVSAEWRTFGVYEVDVRAHSNIATLRLTKRQYKQLYAAMDARSEGLKAESIAKLLTKTEAT